MTWFKVDDGYWSHPKVLLTSLEACGMWVRAGSWSSQHLTDGYVPIPILERIMPVRPAKTAAIAEELEHIGLWVRRGDDWLFHDWEAIQVTRAEVEAEREATRERQRAWRQQRKLPLHDINKEKP